MKTQYKLSLDNPCSENWDQMDQAEKGKFCQLCQKQVINFTSMTDQEIIDTLKSKEDICGYITESQLNSFYTDSPTHESQPKKWSLKRMLSSLFLV